MKTVILILAAGSSYRMGKPKQLLPYKHTTLLGWAIEQAQASSADEVFCMLGAKAKEVEQSINKYGVKIIFNKTFQEGLSSSIVCGIKKIQDKDAVLIMLADQPNITANYLNELLKNQAKHPHKIIASNYNGSSGVPALFSKKYYPELLRLKGDKGARIFLNQHSSDVMKLDLVDLIDVDTPNDYLSL